MHSKWKAMLWIPTTRETEDKQWKQKINSNNNDGQRNDFMVWHLNSDPFVFAVIVFLLLPRFRRLLYNFQRFHDVKSIYIYSKKKKFFFHGLAFCFILWNILLYAAHADTYRNQMNLTADIVSLPMSYIHYEWNNIESQSHLLYP